MVAEGRDFDTTASIEHTESVELEVFPGDICPLASDKGEREMKAKRYTDRPGQLSFWTDGLKVDSGRTEPSVECCDLDWKTCDLDWKT